MIACICPNVIDFLFGKKQSAEEDLRLEGVKSILPTSKIWQFKSFLNVFESLLLNGETKDSLRKKEFEAQEYAKIKAATDLKLKQSY